MPGLVEQFFVSHAACRGDVEVQPGAEPAHGDAEQKDGRDQTEQADAAGPGRGQFLLGAEPPKNQQGGSQHPNRQGKGQHIGDEQGNGMKRQPQAGLAVDHQVQDFLDDVAEEEDEGENEHRHTQRRQHLASQV